MELKIYSCSKCGTIVNSKQTPTNASCLKGLHYWCDIGHAGEDSYQCKNCGGIAKAKFKPGNSGCSNKNGHNWWKL